MVSCRQIVVAAMSYSVMTAGTFVAAAEDDFVQSLTNAPTVTFPNNPVIIMRANVDVKRVQVVEAQGQANLANAQAVRQLRVNQVQVQRQVVPMANPAQRPFDRLVFGMDPKTARLMLDGQVERKVREVSNRYQLSEEKRNKLTMLARADLYRLLHDVQRLQQRYEQSLDDSNAFIVVEREAAVLRQRQRDLLGPDSFFAKSVKTLLEREVIAARYSGLDDSQYLRHLSNVESAVRELDRVVELRQVQKDRLMDLLLKECQPPRTFGDFDDLVLKYRLATMPEDTLKSIVDEEQWPLIRPVLHRFLEYRPLLLERGLIDRNF